MHGVFMKALRWSISIIAGSGPLGRDQSCESQVSNYLRSELRISNYCLKHMTRQA